MVRLKLDLLSSLLTTATILLHFLLWQSERLYGLHKSQRGEGVTLLFSRLFLGLGRAFHGSRSLFLFLLVHLNNATLNARVTQKMTETGRQG